MKPAGSVAIACTLRGSKGKRHLPKNDAPEAVVCTGLSRN